MLDTLAYNQYSLHRSTPVTHGFLRPDEVVTMMEHPDDVLKDEEFFAYCSPHVYGFGLSMKQWLYFRVHQPHDVEWDDGAWKTWSSRTTTKSSHMLSPSLNWKAVTLSMTSSVANAKV